LIGALALTMALLLVPRGALALDESKYPDLKGGYSGDGGQGFHLKADSDSGRSRTAFR
jgi:hypothetical protein